MESEHTILNRFEVSYVHTQTVILYVAVVLGFWKQKSLGDEHQFIKSKQYYGINLVSNDFISDNSIRRCHVLCTWAGTTLIGFGTGRDYNSCRSGIMPIS